MNVDLDLVRKFNVPGPRYTSYPPATHFSEDFEQADWDAHIAANNEGTARDLSLYFHLPFCESLCWFCGCTTVITTVQDKSRVYLDYLEKEMDLMGEKIHADRQVAQLHLGGGTPTFLTAEEILRLGKMVQSRFKIRPDLEAGVEVDPRRLTEEKVQALAEVGFNRASMGVQDNDPRVQEAIHRIQPFAMTAQTVQWVRDYGFESVNIDLIYGLPHQTVKSFEKTLDEVLSLQPDRFAVFSYAHVPWIKPAQKILTDDILPSAEVKLELLKLTIEKLNANGYRYIGMDHFSREDDELTVAQQEKTLQRNFQGYSTKGGVDIYSYGMSSISQAEDIYWQNKKELPDYYADLDAGRLPLSKAYILTAEDSIRRQTIMRLMCDLELDYAAMSELLGLDFEKHFAAELASLDDLEVDGVVERQAGKLVVTDLGRLFIRIIAMRFDEYLIAGKKGRFSQAI
ncbi:MAG: oxygen-independent coproporphyrinogen III oxidase [Verrucomicrobiota bacterium]